MSQDTNSLVGSSSLLTDHYLSLMPDEQTEADERRAARAYMEGSTATMGGHVIATSFLPRLFGPTAREAMGELAEAMHGILVKVIDRYREDPAYRALFSFDERIVELMLLPADPPVPLPFARLDAFIDEDTHAATFCEFNTDGSSGMNENREACNSIKASTAYRRMAEQFQVSDDNERLFGGWVDAFLDLYRTASHPAEVPHVAIVDYLENSVFEEFKVYAGLFAERGVTLSVYDIRDLRYDGGRLRCTRPRIGLADVPIDVIWRRSVASDVLAHWDESDALISCLRDGNVAMIGSFASNVAHDKQLFALLRHPMTRSFLTDEENRLVDETIPLTVVLKPGCAHLDDILANPSEWIVKPADMYGCIGVYAGCEYDPAAWRQIVEGLLDSSGEHIHLAQRFCDPWRSPAIPLRGDEDDYTRPPEPYRNLSGLYVIDGRFSGVFSRQGPGAIILGKYGGVTAASLNVDAHA